MTEKEFEQLWVTAHTETMARKLAEGYPQWLRRRQRARNITLTVLLTAVVSTSTLLIATRHTPQTYDKVYCNRADCNDQQWVDLAASMLLEDA